MSRSLRALVLVAPLPVALAVSLPLSRSVERPDGAAGTVLWWAAITTLSIAAVLLMQHWLRRLLPLAALLNLSMVFPDRAPARFQVARRTGSPQELRRRVEEARRAGVDSVDARGMQTVLELAAALSVHDRRTRGHSERVRVFTDMIAAEMQLSAQDRSKLRWASLLHDIGKLRVSHDLLNKPAAPTAEEWDELRRHPEDGARLAGPIVAWLGVWGPAIAQHHERWDGSGYPHGLAGEEISLGARIVGVADAYETMTAWRPYSRPMKPPRAREELVRCSGSQFDPEVVRAFLSISLGRLSRVVGAGAWVSQLPLLVRLAPGLSAAPAAAGAGAMAAIVATVGVLGPGRPTGTALDGPTTALAARPSAGPATPAPAAYEPPLDGTSSAATLPPSTGSLRPATPTPTVRTAPPAPTATPDTGPVVSAPHTQTVAVGANYHATATFTSSVPGPWTVTIAYGDGTVVTRTVTSAAIDLDHAYAMAGTDTVRVTVTDSRGTSGSATTLVTVR